MAPYARILVYSVLTKDINGTLNNNSIPSLVLIYHTNVIGVSVFSIQFSDVAEVTIIQKLI
jgi:hypothetical protein